MRQAMSILTDTAPQRIWLCISDEPDDYNTPYPELYAEDAEITWSTDQPVAVTVEYVRVDLSEIAKLRAERDALRDEVGLRRHTMPAQYAKLIAERDTLQKERDYALEMVNVQDNKIDKLRSALRIARATIYWLDAREIYDDELALIDAALAGDKP